MKEQHSKIENKEENQKECTVLKSRKKKYSRRVQWSLMCKLQRTRTGQALKDVGEHLQ